MNCEEYKQTIIKLLDETEDEEILLLIIEIIKRIKD